MFWTRPITSLGFRARLYEDLLGIQQDKKHAGREDNLKLTTGFTKQLQFLKEFPNNIHYGTPRRRTFPRGLT